MFLEHLTGLDVIVLVDNERVVEFEDEDAYPNSKDKSSYIETVSDANFAIKISVLRTLAPAPEDCIDFRVYLDGKYANGLIYRLDERKLGSKDRFEHTVMGRDLNTSQGCYVERYKFAQLQTNDGPVGKAKQEDFKNLGEIKVTCTWSRPVGGRTVAHNKRPFEAAIGASVPEKCLKGRSISSRATMGPREARTGLLTTRKVNYPYGKDAFATFRFKYRSRRDLQVEGIIPRSPSPLPLEEREPDDLSLEEARELVRRHRQLQQQQRIEIKKEGSKTMRARSATVVAPSDAKGVVITGSTTSRKRIRRSADSGTELIDLTED